MKAILLSAGQGKRLLPLTANLPKCALPLGEKTALEWQLQALAAAGAGKVVVATGFQAGIVQNIIQSFHELPVRLAHNPFYAHCDNLGTCWVVRHEMTEPFVLINGDTLFEPEIFHRLIAGRHPHPITLVTNRKAHYDDDDMKVSVADGVLRRVDKQLPATEVTGESIGMILFRGKGAGLFRAQLEAMMLHESTLKRWYLSAVDSLARQGWVGTLDTGGHGWCEIDDRQDLDHASSTVPGWWRDQSRRTTTSTPSVPLERRRSSAKS